jgi:hypothetical protein
LRHCRRPVPVKVKKGQKGLICYKLIKF